MLMLDGFATAAKFKNVADFFYVGILSANI